MEGKAEASVTGFVGFPMFSHEFWLGFLQICPSEPGTFVEPASNLPLRDGFGYILINHLDSRTYQPGCGWKLRLIHPQKLGAHLVPNCTFLEMPLSC